MKKIKCQSGGPVKPVYPRPTPLLDITNLSPFTLLPVRDSTLGPVKPSPIINREEAYYLKRQEALDKKRSSINFRPGTLTPEQLEGLKPVHPGGSGKTKSNDRFREYAYGGAIDREQVKKFDKEKLKAVQIDLKAKGLYKGRIDGIYGPLTEAAIEGYNSPRRTINLPQVEIRALSKQTEKQLEANKAVGNFESNYMMVNDNTDMGFVVSPSHEILDKFPVITGRDKGDENLAPSSRSWLKDNPGKTFEDYIKFLGESNSKITPAGLYTVGAKNPNPSTPPGLKAKAKQFAYDMGLVEDEAYNIREKRYTNYGDALISLQTPGGRGVPQAIHGTNNPKRKAALDQGEGGDMSAGCINVGGIVKCYNQLKVGSAVEIMPEDPNQIVDPAFMEYKMLPKQTKQSIGAMYEKKKVKPIYKQTGGALDNILGAVQGAGAFLGPAGMVASGVATLAPLVMDLFNGKDRTVTSASPGRYAYGGDTALSSSSFEVNGDPSQVDSETYSMGDQMVKLDDKEVYKQGEGGGYVYSNRLKEPTTKKRFSELAKAQELGIKKAEKQVARNPYDDYSLNTINFNNKNLANLAGTQEMVATAKGLREPLADARTGAIPRQSGGPVSSFRQLRSPFPNSPGWGIPQPGATPEEMALLQQQVMNPLENLTAPKPYAFSQLGNQPRRADLATIPDAELLDNYNTIRGMGSTDALLDAEVARRGLTGPKRVDLTTVPDAELLDNYNTIHGMGSTDALLDAEVARRGLIKPRGTATRRGTPRKPGKTSGTTTPATTDSLEANILNFSSSEGPYGDPTREIYRNNMPFTTIPSMRNPMATELSSQSRPFSSVTGAGVPQLPTGSALSNEELSATQGSQSSPRVNTPFTFGDTLQTISALSKFGFLAGGPEKQRAYTNSTPITQQTFDPANALYQNQRSFTNTMNRLSSIPSINTSRAVANSLYATNLSQQNNVLSQYQQMNSQARQQYEQRVGARRAENIGYGRYADDINAQNRGMYLNTVQNAFDTLSGLGQNFNQKSQSNAALGLLKETYKDVFDRYMLSLNQQNLFPRNGN